MTREEAVEKIMGTLGFPQGWRWYVNDVLDHKCPGEETLDKETVEALTNYIRIDIRS